MQYDNYVVANGRTVICNGIGLSIPKQNGAEIQSRECYKVRRTNLDKIHVLLFDVIEK